VGIFVIPHLGWRWMLAIGAMPILLLPVVAMILPESPRWLARRGRLDAANHALRRLGAGEVKDVADGKKVGATPVTSVDKVTPLTLFSKPLLRRTLTILPIWLLSSIVVFGISHWAPTIYTSVYHVSHATALQWVTIAGFGYLAAVPVFGMLTDPIGRRRLSIGLCCGAAFLLTALVVFNPPLPLPAILIQTASTALSVMVMILWTYTAETFPTSVRATALGFFSAMNRLPQIFVPILIGAVLKLTGSIMPVFILFAVCAVVIALVWIFFAAETSGRSLEAIEER
jgi:putative MFS transporter